MSTVEFKLKANSKVGFVDNIDIVAAKKTIEKLLQSDLVSFEIEELPTLPEVKKIEMGVLMSPAEICKCDTALKIYFKSKWTGEPFPHNFDCEDIGKRLNIEQNCYPREFYSDIETTWDFSSIPVGSLIEVVDTDDCYAHGLFDKKHSDSNTIRFGCYSRYKTKIKSIRIVELPAIAKLKGE